MCVCVCVCVCVARVRAWGGVCVRRECACVGWVSGGGG